MASSATYRAASVLSSGVYYGGSAIVSTVNSITPHLAGAVDILVIEQPDGSRRSTPFYVRFGKYATFRSREREVKIFVNGEEAPFSMVLGSFGQAYFASETVQLGPDSEHHDALADAMSPVSGYSSGDEVTTALGVSEQLAEGVDQGNSTVVDLGTIQSTNSTTHVQLQHPDNNAATISEVTVYRDSDEAAKAAQKDKYRHGVPWPALGNEPITSLLSPPRSNSTLVSEQPDASGEWMSSSEAAARAVAAVDSDSEVVAEFREQEEVSSRSQHTAAPASEAGMEPSSSFAGVVPEFMRDRGTGKNDKNEEAAVDSAGRTGSESPEEVTSLRRLETRYLSISSFPSFNSSGHYTNGEETLSGIEEDGGAGVTQQQTSATSAPPIKASSTPSDIHPLPQPAPSQAQQQAEHTSKTSTSSSAPAATTPEQSAGRAHPDAAAPTGTSADILGTETTSGLLEPDITRPPTTHSTASQPSSEVPTGERAARSTGTETVLPATTTPAAQGDSPTAAAVHHTTETAGSTATTAPAAVPDGPSSRAQEAGSEQQRPSSSGEPSTSAGSTAPALPPATAQPSTLRQALAHAGESKRERDLHAGESKDGPGSSRGHDGPGHARVTEPVPDSSATSSTPKSALNPAASTSTPDVPGPSSRRADSRGAFAETSVQGLSASIGPDGTQTAGESPGTPVRDQGLIRGGSWPKPSHLSPNINIPTPSKVATGYKSRERNGADDDGEQGCRLERRGVSLSPPHGGSFDSAMSPQSMAVFEAGYMGDVDRRGREGSGSFRQGLPTAPGAVALGIQGFELSLCGHLLSKDMGAGEAQQVFEAHKVSAEQFANTAMQLTQSSDLVVRMGTTLYPWSAAAPIVLGMLAFGGKWDHLTKEACWKLQDGELHAGTKLTPPRKQAGWRLWPFGSWGSSSSQAARAAATAEVNQRSYSAPPGASRDLHLDSLPSEDPAGGSSDEGGLVSPTGTSPPKRVMGKQHVVVKKKTVGPTSEQLASLPLQEGQNHITYRLGKSTELHAYVYLMKWTARLVISDIDGTITKSDILGHVLPAIGYDWSHPGITKLFTNITQNGYQMMYLSSRSIAQASITRDYLHKLDQEGKKMPQGPVIISPQGILPSLYREMILRRPHEFKIACLRDIRSLFPEDCNPFYAGFGNRDTDLMSYKEVGVPTSRIFIINPKGELRKASSTVQSSTWSSLKGINELVHEVFPPSQPVTARSQSVDESFSDHNFWRAPVWVPELDDEEEELLRRKPDKSSSSRFKRSPSEISSDFISSINPL